MKEEQEARDLVRASHQRPLLCGCSGSSLIEKRARCIIPSFERTKEMIKGIVAAPARLTLVPPEDVKELNPR